MQSYHLTPVGNIWRLTREGERRPVGTFSTKAEALQSSEEFMSGREASLKVHKRDGAIEEEQTYPDCRSRPLRRVIACLGPTAALDV